MRYKLNIQNFAETVPDMNTPRYVTWFFKEKLTFTKDIDFYINFYLKGQNVLYNRFYTVSGTPDGYILYYNESGGYMDVYNDTEQWLNEDSRIIRVDSNTLNSQDYNSFVTWAKTNGGVLLEKGTYKWVDTLTFVGTVDVRATFNFISNNTNYEMLDVHSTKGGSMYYDRDTVYVSDWFDNAYKTITTSTDQYVDYDFYAYAIIGVRLVKQETPEPEPTTGKNNLRLGSITPKGYYLGTKKVTKMYLGDTLIYELSSSPQGETWVLNDILHFGAKSWSYNVNFTSNGNSYSTFAYNFSSPLEAYLVYDSTNVYDTNSYWTNTAYKTITFDTAPTGDLLAWLQANGTKQGGTTAHTLTNTSSAVASILVNGKSVTLPYTLKNGDTIVIQSTDFYGFSVNGDEKYNDTTLNLSNTDIVLSGSNPIKTMVNNYIVVTINYTE